MRCSLSCVSRSGLWTRDNRAEGRVSARPASVTVRSRRAAACAGSTTPLRAQPALRLADIRARERGAAHSDQRVRPVSVAANTPRPQT